jgi:hypothetical protein
MTCTIDREIGSLKYYFHFVYFSVFFPLCFHLFQSGIVNWYSKLIIFFSRKTNFIMFDWKSSCSRASGAHCRSLSSHCITNQLYQFLKDFFLWQESRLNNFWIHMCFNFPFLLTFSSSQHLSNFSVIIFKTTFCGLTFKIQNISSFKFFLPDLENHKKLSYAK